MTKSIDKKLLVADINAILPTLTHMNELNKRENILNAVYLMNGWKEGEKGKNKQGMCYIHVALDQVIQSLITEDLLCRPGYGRLAFTDKGLQHFGSERPPAQPRIKDDSTLDPLEVPLPEPEKVVIETVSVYVPDIPAPMSEVHLEQSKKAVPCFGKYSPSESGCISCLLRMACFQHVLDAMSKKSISPKRGKTTLGEDDWMLGNSARDAPCVRCGQIIHKGEMVATPKLSLESGVYHLHCR